MEKYIDYEICRRCGGKCCKENGCVYLPSDFKSMSLKSLTSAIDKGNISISGEPFNGFYGDYWSYVPYLRSRNKGAPIVDLITQGGECINLTDKGCKLSEDKRPSVGLMLRPVEGGIDCSCSDTIKYIYEWLSYCSILLKLVKYYTNRDFVDVLSSSILNEMRRIDTKLGNGEELIPIEKDNVYFYCNVVKDNPYFPIEKVKQIVLNK